IRDVAQGMHPGGANSIIRSCAAQFTMSSPAPPRYADAILRCGDGGAQHAGIVTIVGIVAVDCRAAAAARDRLCKWYRTTEFARCSQPGLRADQRTIAGRSH